MKLISFTMDSAELLTRQLMDKHGLRDWSFSFRDAKTVAGSCNSTKRSIHLSRRFVRVASPEELKDTILHEIAHALTPGAHHGEEWKRVAKRIGCTARRCTSVTFSEYEFTISCACKNAGRHRITEKFRRQLMEEHCRRCKGQYSIKKNF